MANMNVECAILKTNKKSLIKFILTIILFLEITFINLFYIHENLLFFVYILTIYFLLKIISINKSSQLIMVAMLTSITISISNACSLLLISTFFKLNVQKMIQISGMEFNIAIIFSKILFAIFQQIMITYFSKIKNLNSKYYNLFFLILLLSHFSFSFLENILFTGDYSENRIFISIALLVGIDSLVIFQTNKIQEDQYDEFNNAVLAKDINNIQNQIDKMKQTNEEIRILKHDLKNIFIILHNYAENNEYHKVLSCIEDNMRLLQTSTSLVITGIPEIDIILNSKEELAKNNGIEFSKIISYYGKLNDPISVAVLISNALDNAIESISLKKPIITFRIENLNSNILITITNYVDHNVLIDNPNLITTKNYDQKSHGFGISSMKLISEKLQGKIIYNQIDDLFILKVLLPNHQ